MISSSTLSQGTLLASPDILRIAQQDAEQVYRDLTESQILMTLESDGWHVEYNLKQPLTAGGGPHYIIDPATGSILSKRYYQ